MNAYFLAAFFSFLYLKKKYENELTRPPAATNLTSLGKVQNMNLFLFTSILFMYLYLVFSLVMYDCSIFV